MGKRIYLLGRRFGKLTVVKMLGLNKYYSGLWQCQCDCGVETIAITHDLTSGNTKSCGCLKIERLISRSKTHGHNIGHKMTPEYQAWRHMKSRCYNKNVCNYHNYGGRGVKVCGRWLNSFDNFLSDMGRRPSERHSIDRYPDKSGNYEPSNCRWATPKEQARNVRTNRWIEHRGERLILSDWALKLNGEVNNLSRMIKKKGVKETFKYYENKVK